MTEIIIERKLNNLGWERIYLPIRIIKNGKIIFETSEVPSKTIVKKNII